jgi:hypothetical protein
VSRKRRERGRSQNTSVKAAFACGFLTASRPGLPRVFSAIVPRVPIHEWLHTPAQAVPNW